MKIYLFSFVFPPLFFCKKKGFKKKKMYTAIKKIADDDKLYKLCGLDKMILLQKIIFVVVVFKK